MLKLPKRMEEVLLKVYGGDRRESEVARELGISKQAVSKFVREGRARLTEILIEVAEVLQADVIRVNPMKGYAVLKCRGSGVKAYVIYVPGKGPRVIFSNSLELSEDVVKAVKEWGLVRGCSNDLIKCLVSTLES